MISITCKAGTIIPLKTVWFMFKFLIANSSRKIVRNHCLQQLVMTYVRSRNAGHSCIFMLLISAYCI